jgi:hypothetical protein
MKITIRRKYMPSVATQVFPTVATLRAGYEWYKSASPEDRERFRQARLSLVKRYGPLRANYQNQYTSGSTGKRKHYLWGPNFKEVDRFFYSLVRDGDRLGKTCELMAYRIRDNGGENLISLVEPSKGRYDIDKYVFIDVNGIGRVPKLRDELSGHNLFISPSVFMILERAISLTEDMDPSGMVIFTGESLPPATRSYLLDKGFDVRDEMRCWDGGATFFTCRYGNRHWVDYLAGTTTDEENRLVCDDYFNLVQPHVGYRNGDVVLRRFGEMCVCGELCCENEFASRTSALCFNTPTGVTATYEALFDLFCQGAGVVKDDVAAVCFGRHPGDARLRIHYMIHDQDESRCVEVEEGVSGLFFKSLGLRTDFVRDIQPGTYKLRKMFLIE